MASLTDFVELTVQRLHALKSDFEAERKTAPKAPQCRYCPEREHCTRAQPTPRGMPCPPK